MAHINVRAFGVSRLWRCNTAVPMPESVESQTGVLPALKLTTCHFSAEGLYSFGSNHPRHQIMRELQPNLRCVGGKRPSKGSSLVMPRFRRLASAWQVCRGLHSHEQRRAQYRYSASNRYQVGSLTLVMIPYARGSRGHLKCANSDAELVFLVEI